MAAQSQFKNAGEFLSGLASYSILQTGFAPSKHAQLLAKKFATLAVGADEARGDSDPAGGFLVPDSFSSALLARSFAFSKYASRCRNLYISGQSLKAPLMRETSRADGSRLGGVQTNWRAESVQMATSQPTFGQLVLTPHMAYVLIPASDEWIYDTQAAEQIIALIAAEEIAVTLDDKIANGSGVGEPTGITGHAGTIVVTKETDQQANTIVARNITKMLARLWPYLLEDAAFFASPSAAEFILSSADIQPYIRFAEPGAPVGEARFTLAGCPLIITEQAKTLGTVGDLTLAAMNEYALGDKGAPTMLRSIHVRYIHHSSLFKIFYRVDGAPMWKSPVAARNESYTQSAFVQLETRS